MYMIAGLCMLKLYQKRHPDINASAYSAYACLAVIIFFSVVGVVSEHTSGLPRGLNPWGRWREAVGIPEIAGQPQPPPRGGSSKGVQNWGRLPWDPHPTREETLGS